MAFEWPSNVYAKTKIRIAQILWTLWLDFEGEVADDVDAVKVLLDAMRAHGVDIPDDEIMSYRIIMPHLDGGKYGHYIQRLVIGRQTRAIKLVSDLPNDSELPDGAGGYSYDERIDRQLFGAIGPESQPARGDARDVAHSGEEPARGDARDANELHPETRDKHKGVETAPRAIGDNDVSPGPRPVGDSMTRPPAPSVVGDVVPDPARGETRDSERPARGETRDSELARESSRDFARDRPRDAQNLPSADDDETDLAREVSRDALGAPIDDDTGIAATIRRLDGEVEELFTPDAPVEMADAGSHRELLDTIVSLIAELEGRLSVGVGRVEPPGRAEADWQKLESENVTLAGRLGSVLRRAKDAEARLMERNKEAAGLRLQISTLVGQNERLEANNQALLAGERAGGQHVKGAQRFLAEVPSDRPEEGRNRRRRTTGSDSQLAYSVGPK